LERNKVSAKRTGFIFVEKGLATALHRAHCVGGGSVRVAASGTSRVTATRSRSLTDPSLCVLRGGSWNNNPQNTRAANRNRNQPNNRSVWSGFRVASTLHARAVTVKAVAGVYESVQGSS
jgi:hypothetical protein